MCKHNLSESPLITIAPQLVLCQYFACASQLMLPLTLLACVVKCYAAFFAYIVLFWSSWTFKGSTLSAFCGIGGVPWGCCCPPTHPVYCRAGLQVYLQYLMQAVSVAAWRLLPTSGFSCPCASEYAMHVLSAALGMTLVCYTHCQTKSGGGERDL